MPASPGGYRSTDERQRRIARVRDLWSEGVPAKVIAERLGTGPAVVSRLARAAGCEPRRNRLTVENPAP